MRCCLNFSPTVDNVPPCCYTLTAAEYYFGRAGFLSGGITSGESYSADGAGPALYATAARRRTERRNCKTENKYGFYIETLGCRVNLYESQSLSEVLERSGFRRADLSENPDFILINSCTVTAESSRKTRRTVRKLKAICPGARTVLFGCYPQGFPDDAKNLTQADIVIGNMPFDEIPALLRERINGTERTVNIRTHSPEEKYGTPAVTGLKNRVRAEIKIEDGCDRFCSYCVIPRCKGRVRSRTPDDIYKEAVALRGNGYREIVLVGINLSAYGKDNGFSLADAADAVCSAGIDRVRLSSLEFDMLDDATLERLKTNRALCPQFHLSLQSGSDRILRAMNRGYTSAEYAEFAEKLRSLFPKVSLTTDIIAGFPGESEEDFEQTIELVKKIGFARVHIFPFSKRPGTPAAEIPEQIPRRIKEERCRRLSEVCGEASRAFRLSLVGSIENVLFETFENGFCEGYGETYIRIKVASGKDLTGLVLPVTVTAAEDAYCTGELYGEKRQ